ncbi:hypothetical protein EYV94_10685 [Puteibacter caeruleilacunae]|nr:hypothetical protein EYV94_10685 [Puteibacter caeruleilacunae]
MNKPKNYKALLDMIMPFVFILVIVVIGILSHKAHAKRSKYEVVNRDSSLSIKVDRTAMYRVATTFVVTPDKKHYQIPWADNMAYDNMHLSNFVMMGDSICKSANSDSLFVIREGQRYHFVLEQRIWNSDKAIPVLFKINKKQ